MEDIEISVAAKANGYMYRASRVVRLPVSPSHYNELEAAVQEAVQGKRLAHVQQGSDSLREDVEEAAWRECARTELLRLWQQGGQRECLEIVGAAFNARITSSGDIKRLLNSADRDALSRLIRSLRVNIPGAQA